MQTGRPAVAPRHVRPAIRNEIVPMQSMDRRAFMSALALVMAPAVVSAEALRSAQALVQAFLARHTGPGKLPGAVLAVQRTGAEPRFVSVGTIAPDSDTAMTPDSLFRIYSMTKPITCMAVLKLMEDGKLQLDQPLSDILPEFSQMRVITDLATMETRPATRPILIRHLLTHTAGFSYSISADPLARIYSSKGLKPGGRALTAGPGDELAPARDLEEFVQRLAPLPLLADPGARWIYSVAMDVLGLVIQRVSGMSFHAYLKETLLNPLGMDDTDFMVPAGKADRFTSVVARRGDSLIVSDDRRTSAYLRDRELPSGGGGLVSTARDYARFMAMVLNKGRAGDTQVVASQTAELFRTNLLEPGVTFGGGNGFGAGVSVATTGRPGMEPAGTASWFGIAGTQMWMDPANGLGVALLIQSMPGPAGMADELRQAIYGDVLAGAA